MKPAVQAAAEAVAAGKTRRAAAQEFNVNESSIYRYMVRNKMPLPGPRRGATGPRRPPLPMPEPFYFADGTPLVTP